ncbi:MAG: NAD-dependent epimerase/dehydratase family protein [Pseudomonadota bacterium]|nr:NAD-dependent epimerase/dehydratase family protein [Pseudomonadota bacterium]
MGASTVRPFSSGKNRALIIGATGFVGRHLASELNQNGYCVSVLSRGSYISEFPGVNDESQWLTGELPDTGKVLETCRSFEVVFHLANVAHVAESDRDLLSRVNVEGTKSVCRACSDAGVSRLVYFSSSLAGNPSTSFYAASKSAAEAAVLAAGRESGSELHVTVLRPVNIYGPGMKGNLAGLVKRIVLGRMPPLPKLENRIALISVKDVCRIAIAAAEGQQASGAVYTLTDGEYYTPKRIEAAIYKALGREQHKWTTPRMIFFLAALVVQIGSYLRIVNSDLGLRTYRNLLKDQPAGESAFASALSIAPSLTFESELPEILKSLEKIIK